MLFYVYRVINGRILSEPEACYNTRADAEAYQYQYVGRQFIVVEE